MSFLFPSNQFFLKQENMYLLLSILPPGTHTGVRTYRAGAGVSPDFRWFLPCRWSFEVNTSIVLRMNPLHLVSWFLKWIKTTLRPLNPDFFILRNCIQRFDHWIHSLAVPCRHLGDTYLKGKKQHSLTNRLKVCVNPYVSLNQKRHWTS